MAPMRARTDCRPHLVPSPRFLSPCAPPPLVHHRLLCTTASCASPPPCGLAFPHPSPLLGMCRALQSPVTEIIPETPPRPSSMPGCDSIYTMARPHSVGSGVAQAVGSRVLATVCPAPLCLLEPSGGAAIHTPSELERGDYPLPRQPTWTLESPVRLGSAQRRRTSSLGEGRVDGSGVVGDRGRP